MRPCSQFRFRSTLPEGAGVAAAFLAAAAVATFLAAAVVLVEVTTFFVALGLTVLIVLPLTTIFCFVLFAVVAVVFFTVPAFDPAPIAFFNVPPREGFVIMVPLFEETVLWSDTLDRIDACDAVRCGERLGIAVAEVLLSVANAGLGGGSILPVGEAGTGIAVPRPVRVGWSFSRLMGRASLAPAAPAAAYPRLAKADIADIPAVAATLKGDCGFVGEGGRICCCC